MKWFLVIDQRDKQILFYVFIYIYNILHVSSTSWSLSGETNCINTASGNNHSMLVAEMCAGSSNLRIEWLLPEVVINTICLSWWWARCARNMYRVINRNKYIENNLCITLVNYQESLHDTRSTKCKILPMKCPVHIDISHQLAIREKLYLTTLSNAAIWKYKGEMVEMWVSVIDEMFLT